MQHSALLNVIKPTAVVLVASLFLTACGQSDQMNLVKTDWSDLNTLSTLIVTVH